MARVLMQAGLIDPVQHFSGSFYGVRACVDLNMRTRVATVSLQGAVLGGTVTGTGWLSDSGAEAGSVVLEKRFEARLRRHFVKVRGASLNRAQETVTVHVVMPVLGEMELVLGRAK